MKTQKKLRALAAIPLILSLVVSGCGMSSQQTMTQTSSVQSENSAQSDENISQSSENSTDAELFQPPWDESTVEPDPAFYGYGNEYGCAFIRPDGTVASEGFLDGVSSEMDTWCGVKQLALQYDGCATYGLLSDGTVSFTGELYGESLKKVENWTDVEQLYPYRTMSRFDSLDSIHAMVGLSKKGELLYPYKPYRVIYKPYDEISALSWSNIKMFDTQSLNFAVMRDGKVLCDDGAERNDFEYMETLSGVKKIGGEARIEFFDCYVLMEDGSIVYPYNFTEFSHLKEDRLKELTEFKESIENWTNIEDIYSYFPESLIGIGKDHTVKTEFVSSFWDENFVFTPENWTDIRQFVYNYMPNFHGFFGIKGDGSVVYAYSKSQTDLDLGLMLKPIDDWENIIALDYSENHVVGLKIDGTVVATGDNSYGQCDVSEWTDIISIVAGPTYTAGLQSDGTIVIAGQFEEIEE